MTLRRLRQHRSPTATPSHEVHDAAREAAGVVEAAKVPLRMHLTTQRYIRAIRTTTRSAAQCSPEVQRLYAALAAHEAAQQDAGMLKHAHGDYIH